MKSLTIQSSVWEHADLLGDVIPGSGSIQTCQMTEQSLPHFQNSRGHGFDAIHPVISVGN